jgi:hypothetical protein
LDSVAIRASGLKPSNARPSNNCAVAFMHSLPPTAGAGTGSPPVSKFLSQAHFLRGEILRKQLQLRPRDNGPAPAADLATATLRKQQQQQQQQQQQAYELAVQWDPHNIPLLLACARRMVGPEHGERQLHLYRQIVAVNKYHVAANLWLARHYRQLALDLSVPPDVNAAAAPPAGPGDIGGHPDGGALPTSSSSSSSLPSSFRQRRQADLLHSHLTSCYASILRAEFRATSDGDRQACADLRVDLQTNFPAFYSNSKTRQMDRISAAFVPY